MNQIFKKKNAKKLKKVKFFKKSGKNLNKNLGLFILENSKIKKFFFFLSLFKFSKLNRLFEAESK